MALCRWPLAIPLFEFVALFPTQLTRSRALSVLVSLSFYHSYERALRFCSTKTTQHLLIYMVVQTYTHTCIHTLFFFLTFVIVCITKSLGLVARLSKIYINFSLLSCCCLNMYVCVVISQLLEKLQAWRHASQYENKIYFCLTQYKQSTIVY